LKTKWIPALAFLLVIFLWGGSWYWLYDFKERGTFGDMFGAVNALFSGLAFGGVIYAILLQREDLERQKEEVTSRKKESVSETYLNNSITLLERAYLVLSDLDDTGLPKNKRINWLASARFLKAGESLSGLITEDAHKRIYKEHLEYWRARLHDLIMPSQLGNVGFTPNYFAERAEHLLAYSGRTRPPLALRSVALLYRFVRWPRDYEDPLKGESSFTLEEIEKMNSFGPKGLGALLTEYEQLKLKKDA